MGNLHYISLVLFSATVATAQVGIGTTLPAANLHINSSTPEVIDLRIEAANDGVEIELAPGGTGNTYTFVANDNPTSGLTIKEGTQVILQARENGKFYITDFNSIKNAALSYPATVYADASGKIFVGGTRSPLDDLKVNTTTLTPQVASVVAGVTDTEAVTSSLYSYSVTPIQDILLEVTYQVGVKMTQTIDTSIGPNQDDWAGLYGAYIQVGTTKYAMSSTNYSGNDINSFLGPYTLTGHCYIPLYAGTAYTIDLFGFVHSAFANTTGWRGEFVSGSDNRLQILDHY
jgi:hypothetical protein